MSGGKQVEGPGPGTQCERESRLRRLAHVTSVRRRVGWGVKTRGAQYEKKNGFGHVARERNVRGRVGRGAWPGELSVRGRVGWGAWP